MKISIIIPSYNCGKYIPRLLASLEKQLTSEVEVLVVNDGSTDDTLAVLGQFKGIKVIDKPNGGVSSARNAGLEIAQGEYIAFIDADDMVSDNYVSEILSKINDNDDYFYISWKFTGNQDREVIIEEEPPLWNCCVWNTVFKKETIGEKRFDEKMNFAEDYDFNARVKKSEMKRGNIRKVLYFYWSGREDGICMRRVRREL